MNHRGTPTRRATHRSRRWRGVTLIEVVLAAGVLGVLIVGVINAAGAAAKTASIAAERAIAAQLADELLADVMRRAYADESGATTLGPDSGESIVCRDDCDDVDDFNNWTEKPPQYEDGTKNTTLNRWSRSVKVSWVDPANFTQTKSSDSGVKLITVTVYRDGAKVLTRSAMRCGTPVTGSASVSMPSSLTATVGSGGIGLGLNLNLLGGK